MGLWVYKSTLGDTLNDKILGLDKTYPKILQALSLNRQNKQNANKNENRSKFLKIASRDL